MLKYKVFVFGFLRVIAPNGQDVTPRGQRSKALFSLIALSPQLQRSRERLQSILWSDSEPTHAAGSLRKQLHQLRKDLGDVRKDLLLSVEGALQLNQEFFEVCFEIAPNSTDAQIHDQGAVLLEGVDPREPEFDNWLRDVRQTWSQPESRGRDSEEAEAPQGRLGGAIDVALVQAQEDAPHLETVNNVVVRGVLQLTEEATETPIRVRSQSTTSSVERPPTCGDRRFTATGRLDGDCYNLSLAEEVSDARFTHLRPGLALHMSQPVDVQNDSAACRAQNRMLAEIIDGADVASLRSEEDASSRLLCAMAAISRPTLSRLAEADRALEPVGCETQSPVVLAWRAFLRLHQAIECGPHQKRALECEALEFAAEAVSNRTRNSFVLSVRAYAAYLVEFKFSLAHDLAERSIEVNRANCLAWATLSICRSDKGHKDEALSALKNAQAFCAQGPFQHVVDLAAMIVKVKCREFDDALQAARVCHSFTPGLLAPLRFMIPLAYRRGLEAEADGFVAKIRRQETAFTLDCLRDPDYPATTIRTSPLVDFIPRSQL